MNKAEAQKRILKLRELINDYRYHYHVLDESTMSRSEERRVGKECM